MRLLITVVMMGLVNLVAGDPASEPYPWFCVPPNGSIVPTTTPGPDYLAILPIERCCPACEECVNVGGHCKIRWLTEIYPEWCDFTTINECRDYSCTCCIKCVDDKCSDCTQTGGNCRVDCRNGELVDPFNKCSYGDCQCCKKCEAMDECTDALGQCVTSPAECPTGSFASTGCCGGCYCCKPVLEGTPGDFGEPPGCSEPGAYCSETDECATGFYPCFGRCQKTEWLNNIHRVVPGYCCMPKSVNGGTSGRRSVDTFVKQMIGYGSQGNGRRQDQF